MTRMRRALVGAFVLGGLLLFGGGLFLIGERRLLFTESFELNTRFGKVTGLEVGTPVRIAGLGAGEVLEIVLPSRPSDSFVVRMRLREDMHPLVRTDSTAAIQTNGIVGNSFIQVSVGTDSAPRVDAGGTIPGVDPIEFSDLIREGRDTFRTVSREMVDLKGDVSSAIVALTATIDTTNGVIDDVGRDVGRMSATSAAIMEDVQGTMADARRLVHDVGQGQGTVGQLLTDRTVYDRLAGVAREAEQTATNLRQTTEQARAAVAEFTGSGGTGPRIAQTLRTTLNDIQEVTSDLAENTEALKRNFLFRGFFHDRGFFDLDSLSRDAYQSGALEKDRTAIRIWIREDVLFEVGPEGVEQLTAEGRRRIDSAMADLVRYPRNSPLVVEGYSGGGQGESAYLLSTDRAQLVHDYLLARYRRQATITGMMPMGALAPESPASDKRWSGVALALFVRNDALAERGQAGR